VSLAASSSADGSGLIFFVTSSSVAVITAPFPPNLTFGDQGPETPLQRQSRTTRVGAGAGGHGGTGQAADCGVIWDQEVERPLALVRITARSGSPYIYFIANRIS
jgi:hypothetical protein